MLPWDGPQDRVMSALRVSYDKLPVFNLDNSLAAHKVAEDLGCIAAFETAQVPSQPPIKVSTISFLRLFQLERPAYFAFILAK
jgi:hypothetical protein